MNIELIFVLKLESILVRKKFYDEKSNKVIVSDRSDIFVNFVLTLMCGITLPLLHIARIDIINENTFNRNSR